MNTATIGGVCVGLSLLIGILVRWWYKENHKIAALVPYLLSFAYGTLAILTVGSVLAGAAGITLWAGNGLGDLGLVFGIGGTTGNVTRGAQAVLTQGGYVVMFLFTALMVSLVLFGKDRIPVGKLLAGTVMGIMLGLSGTWAGVAAVPLASAVNALGYPATAMIR